MASLKTRLKTASQGIDDHGVLYTPLDFSFMQIVRPSEALEKSPRGVPPRVRRATAKVEKEKEKEEYGIKFETNSLRLNNNQMTQLSGLNDVIERLIVGSFAALQWLDISFNKLPSIDKVFLRIPNLKILYLHGNKVSDLSEADKLTACYSLRKLTLQGNPIDQLPGYRSYVLSRVPQLLNLDTTPVSDGDRSNAATYRSFHPTTKTKKKEDQQTKNTLIKTRPHRATHAEHN